MLQALRVSDAIMVNVDLLHFGKLISSADGMTRAPEALGVTRRSKGLKAEDVGELRPNTLLEVQAFSQNMIDPAMGDTGPLLVRTLAPTPAQPHARTVFVRARFRQESAGSSDSRVHQQAAIWVVRADLWRQHPAAILAKVAADLRADPDRADDNLRFDTPPLEVALDPGERLHANESAPKAKDAYWRILDMLLPQRFAETRPADRSITFGGNVFGTEDEFLAIVSRALNVLPRSGTEFSRWNDIRIGSGLRQARGGLLISYLPSETIRFEDDIDSVSIEMRLQRTAGGLGVEDSRLSRVVLTPVQTLPWSQLKPEAAETPVRIHAAPANSFAMALPADALSGFDARLTEYRHKPDQSTAQALYVAAGTLNRVSSVDDLDPFSRTLCEAVLSVGSAPSAQLRLGALYDRALFVVHVGTLSTQGLWIDALSEALFKVGVLLQPELRRLHDCALSTYLFKPGTKLLEVVNNSDELEKWQCQLKTNVDSNYIPQNIHFIKKLLLRCADMSNAKPHDDNRGIHHDVMVSANVVASPDELSSQQDTLLRCAVASLHSALYLLKTHAT